MPTSEDRLSHALYQIYQMFLIDARITSEGGSEQSIDATSSPAQGQSGTSTQALTTTHA
jgi:hypothetical protein